MLHYLRNPGCLTHLVDELHGTKAAYRRTLCGRVVIEGSVHESERAPGCGQCARVLRRLHRQLDAKAPPLRSAPRALATPADLQCPVCGQTMGLAAKRHSFPTHRVNAVRVTMVLICNNEASHQKEP